MIGAPHDHPANHHHLPPGADRPVGCDVGRGDLPQAVAMGEEMTEAKQGLVQSATADAGAAGDHPGGEVAAPRITVEEFRGMLARECSAAGTQKAWADLHNISSAFVSDVLNGRREPGPAMCTALGLRRVILFEARNATA